MDRVYDFIAKNVQFFNLMDMTLFYNSELENRETLKKKYITIDAIIYLIYMTGLVTFFDNNSNGTAWDGYQGITDLSKFYQFNKFLDNILGGKQVILLQASYYIYILAYIMATESKNNVYKLEEFPVKWYNMTIDEISNVVEPIVSAKELVNNLTLLDEKQSESEEELFDYYGGQKTFYTLC